MPEVWSQTMSITLIYLIAPRKRLLGPVIRLCHILGFRRFPRYFFNYWLLWLHDLPRPSGMPEAYSQDPWLAEAI